MRRGYMKRQEKAKARKETLGDLVVEFALALVKEQGPMTAGEIAKAVIKTHRGAIMAKMKDWRREQGDLYTSVVGALQLAKKKGLLGWVPPREGRYCLPGSPKVVETSTSG